jgi:hypothetical protein
MGVLGSPDRSVKFRKWPIKLEGFFFPVYCREVGGEAKLFGLRSGRLRLDVNHGFARMEG